MKTSNYYVVSQFSSTNLQISVPMDAVSFPFTQAAFNSVFHITLEWLAAFFASM
jgi:hypothetical protein